MYETRGNAKFYYSYDANGTLYSVKYTLTDSSDLMTYYFTHNSRGDIVGIYNGAGQLRARYEYDAWGNVLSVTDQNGNAITSATHIGNLNPFRYRGYYLDTETGLYYLMSRYYDPVTHRFVNADGYFQSGGDVLEGNMSAYCGNNPIMRADPSGEFWGMIAAIAVGTFLFGSLVNAISLPDNPISGASSKTTTRINTQKKDVVNLGIAKVETGVHNDVHTNRVGNSSSKPITFTATGRGDNWLLSSVNMSVHVNKFTFGINFGGDFTGFNFSHQNDDNIQSLDVFIDPSSLSLCIEHGITTKWDDTGSTTTYTKGSISAIATGALALTVLFPESQSLQPSFAH